MSSFFQSATIYARTVYAKGFFHLLSANFLIQFLGFGTSLFVSKFLSPEDLGSIKIIQSYTILFWVIAGFGLNSAVLKFCSEDRREDEKQGLLRYAITHSVIPIIVTLSLLMYLANAGYITSSESLAFWLSVYAIVIPFGVFTDILIAYLQATKHIREMARAQAIIRFQSFTLVVMATWLYGMPGFIFATICAYIVGLIPLLWQVKLNFFKYSIKAIPNTFYNIAIFSALANSVATLRQYSDIFILDLFTQNRTEIGYYSLATIFVLAASQITSTVQAISTPYLSERASDLVWFRSKVFDTQLRMSLLSMAVGVGIYILCWLLVHFFYGITYQSTITYASILIIRYIIWSSCAVIGPALFALEMVRYNFVSAVISTLFGIFFSYHWLQQFGIIGVAWAQVIAAIILFILSYGFFFLVLRRLATY